MPQLELLDFPSQIFWLFVTFSFLYLVLSRSLLPTISDVLKDRQTRIADDLEKAAKLKQQAENAEEDFTSALADAREKASAMIAESRRKVVEEEALQYAKLDAVFEKQSKEADARIKRALEDVESIILPAVTSASVDIVDRLIGAKVDEKKAAEIAKELI